MFLAAAEAGATALVEALVVSGVPLDAAEQLRSVEGTWEWRGNADERRAREMTDTYEELGFEVKIEPLDLNQLSEGCFGCKDVLNDFGAVYVRKKN